jgi:hypothetical protein
MIENMDAKLMMSLGATRAAAGPGAEGNWTEYMKAFAGRLYRPDVAPADAPVMEEVPGDDGAPPVTVQPKSNGTSNGRPEPVVPIGSVEITNPLFASVETHRK